VNWRRVVAIARKESIQISRDWRSLAIVLVMPIALTLINGYAVALDVRHVPTCALDREGSQDSQALLHRFRASQYFRMRDTVTNYAQLTREIDAGRCMLGIAIPYDFSKRIRDGGEVGVQAILDASDNNTAQIVVGYAQAVIAGYSTDVQIDWLHRHGVTNVSFPLRVDARTWFNEDLESRNYILPGVIAIVMAIIGAFLTALTVAREWERGTMEQLISTPVTPLEIMLGKLAPYFVVGMVATALCAAVGILWFEVPFRGRLITLLVSSALFLAVVLASGFWISVVSRTQLVASQAAIVITYMPAFMLSGFVFPIDQMPWPIRVVTYFVAARYYDTILRAIFLKGVGLGTLVGEIAPLLLMTTIIGAFALFSFRKQLL
jgi:drug efflux transport system permease protein